MHISLTPALEDLVKSKVGSGLYNNSSEVVREALRLMQREDELYNVKLESLRREILLGDEQIENGRFSSKGIDSIINEIDEL